MEKSNRREALKKIATGAAALSAVSAPFRIIRTHSISEEENTYGFEIKRKYQSFRLPVDLQFHLR